MKILLLFFLLLVSNFLSFSQVSSEKAKELFQDRFISALEAKKIFPEIPLNLKINYSEEILLKDSLSILMPIHIGNTFQYNLVRIETDSLSNEGKYSLEETKKIVKLILNLRTELPFQKNSFSKPYSCFFKTKGKTDKEKGIDFCSIVSCSKNIFLTIEAPVEVQYGLINSDYVVFIVKDKKSSLIGSQELEKGYFSPGIKAQAIKIFMIKIL